MARRYTYEYPRPAVTVDLAVFARKGKGLRVLLIRRKHDPFAGSWALPGGFLEMDEPVEVGARRELAEETGLFLPGPTSFVGAFGEPGRDPRCRTISLVYATAISGPLPNAAGNDDAAEAAWLDPWTVAPLAFDHRAILNAALNWLKQDVEAGPSGRTLLPEQFQLADVVQLFRAVGVSPASAMPWLDQLTRLGVILKTEQGYARTVDRAAVDLTPTDQPRKSAQSRATEA